MISNTKLNGGWKIEAVKAGGAVAIIVALTYLFQALPFSSPNEKILELWEKQTVTLTEIRNLLSYSIDENKRRYEQLDSLSLYISIITKRLNNKKE